MAEIRIKTEVAGRVCSTPTSPGATVKDGDEIIFVEAMKMEIPVTATSDGKLKQLLVKVDDIVAEEQVVAILEA